MHDKMQAFYDSKLRIGKVTTKTRGSLSLFRQATDCAQVLLVLLLKLIHSLNCQKGVTMGCSLGICTV